MYDFEVCNVSDQKHTAEDGLSRKPYTAAKIAKAKAEKDIDNFILVELNSLWVSPIFFDDPTLILADKYLDDSQKITTHLLALRQLLEIDIKI